MKSCKGDQCVTLIVHGTAEKGTFAPLYAFAESTFISSNKQTNKKTVYSVKEGYYDSNNSEIVLRGVKELSLGDMIANLKTGEIKKFKK